MYSGREKAEALWLTWAPDMYRQEPHIVSILGLHDVTLGIKPDADRGRYVQLGAVFAPITGPDAVVADIEDQSADLI